MYIHKTFEKFLFVQYLDIFRPFAIDKAYRICHKVAFLLEEDQKNKQNFCRDSALLLNSKNLKNVLLYLLLLILRIIQDIYNTKYSNLNIYQKKITK